jgi:inorganic phosphate transporter, PiT family
MQTFLLVLIVAIALIFDYTNGFHDTANAIATSVSTRAISPRLAVLGAAAFNFLGAFVSTRVAKTVGSGIVNPDKVTLLVVLAALIGAIAWNLITWYFGIPSSSSHALIGGLIGAMLVYAGISAVLWADIAEKVVLPMILAPLIGFAGARIIMIILLWIVARRPPAKVNRAFRVLQLFSASFMAFSHGSNDAQKTMGIIALALFSTGNISTFTIPLWVVAVSATAMALGTYSGGWRIIHTLGSRVIKLDPIHGFAAETSAATVIQATAHFGFPISTTQAITAAIMGSGSAQRLSAVRWAVAGDIGVAWVLTIPAAGAIAAVSFLVLDLIF